MDIYNFIIKVCIYAPSAVLAITLHEAAHGYVAKHFGDTTAYMLGRVTLNPLKHIDPLGTIVVPIVTAFTGFIFGWAKPVPVNFNNLRHPKRDMLWVAAAGPGSNLVQAIIWAIIAKMLLMLPETEVATYWLAVSEAGILINILIGIFNLFPLLPLDGGRMLVSVLPNRLSYSFSRLEPFGFPILILLIVTGVFGRILGPLVTTSLTNIYALIGLQ